MKKTIAILLALLFALQVALLPAAAEGETPSDVPELTTIDDVTAFVRQEMVRRSTEIRYKASNVLIALFGGVLNSVCQHTGNGAEGDYLRLALNYVMPQPEQDADGVYTLCPVYYTTAEQEAAVDAYVETVVAGCTAQDATGIARYLYDYLCENVTFDLENLYNDADLLKYTAYGAAVNGRAVCQGFAQLYYKLALAAGLDCRIVTGTRGNDAHAWNIIQIDDLWYHVDASSGAQLLDNSAYFMKRLFDGYTISYGEKTAAEIQGYSFVLGNEDDEIITASYNEFTYTLNKTTGELVINGMGDIPRALHLVLPSEDDVDLIKSVVVADGITGIGSIFRNCHNLLQISLPSTVISIPDRAFEWCPMKADSVYLSEDNPYFSLRDGCLIEISSKKLLLGSNQAIIPDDDSVETICDSAFRNCSELTEVCIPASVKVIEDAAFVFCTGLQNLSFAERNGAELTIGSSAFSNCTALTELNFPEGLTCINYWAFSDCSELRRLSLPSTVRSIAGTSAFNYCGKLESITVDSENAWYHSAGNCLIATTDKVLITGCCNSVIPDDGSVTSIGHGNGLYESGEAFNGCTGLEEIIIPEGITVVSGFNGCTGLTEIEFPDSVTHISGFSGCSSLNSVKLPNQLKSLTGFRNCTALEHIDLPNTITSLGAENNTAFSGCTALTNLELPESIRFIFGFNNCSGLTSVTIPLDCYRIYQAFKNCSNLKEMIVLSKNVELMLEVYALQPDCIVYGFKGSTAESHARFCNLAFVPLCPLTNEPHNVQTVNATEPDCLNPGYTAGTVCPDCGEWITGHEQTADALGHNPGEPAPENVVAATCTAEGSYDNVTRCTRCGEVLASTAEKIAMTPHADEDHNGYCDDCGEYICAHPETSLQNDRAPACLEPGYTGDTVCSWCGATVTYGVTVPATGHSPAISRPAKDATCLDPGATAEVACTVCHDVITPAQPTPIAAHSDGDGDGRCDVCLAPTDCTQYGRCGDLFWYADNGNLVISGSGASGDLAAVPWESCADSIDCVYLKAGVTAMDGAPFAACPGLAWVFASAGATVSSCEAPVLYYSDESGVVTVSGRDGAPAMDLPALLNAASVLCTDRTVAALCFERLSLCATDGGDEVVYDILKNGKIIDEHHFRLPSGTELRAFRMRPLSYPSFNTAFAAIADNPDRTLILSLTCDDMLPTALKSDSASYTEQFVLHFVDEPTAPDAPDAEKTFAEKIVERFQATLAAILSLFKKLVKLFKR